MLGDNQGHPMREFGLELIRFISGGVLETEIQGDMHTKPHEDIGKHRSTSRDREFLFGIKVRKS